MVFEIVNELIDSAFMTFGSEAVGLLILVIKLFGIGYIAYQLLKLVFKTRK